MILHSHTIGDFKANLYQYKLGYGYKIFTKINNKNTCVDQSFVYFNDKIICYDKMISALNMLMGMNELF